MCCKLFNYPPIKVRNRFILGNDFNQSFCLFTLGAYERWVKDEAEEGNGSIETTVHKQIVQEKAKQDSNLVISLILQSLREYKKSRPDVTKVWIKADNAG